MTTKIQHHPTPALVEDGHAHLRDLIQMAALHAQHNMDSTFILQFVDMYMQKDESGLNCLQYLIKEHCDSIPATETNPIENHLTEQILLSFYIGLLLRIIQSSDASILDRPSVDQFLRQHQSMLFDRQYHSTLPELVYKFLLELHNSKMPLKQWPLQSDLHEMIVVPLADECTPLALRQDIERLAIAQMMATTEQEYLQQFLADSLADVLLVADFSPVLESCSKILGSCKNIAHLISKDLFDRILQKAKKVKRIGHSFAQMAAKLMAIKMGNQFDVLISEGFLNPFSHSLVLSKLAIIVQAESNVEDIYRHKLVLNLLATVSDYDLNLIGPLLCEHYQKALNREEFIQLLKKLVEAGKWRRNLSKESLKAFVDALFDVDPEQCDLIQNIVNIIIPNILSSTSALSLLEAIEQRGSIFHKFPEMGKILGEMLRPILTDVGNEQSMTEIDWDSIDSALRILAICGYNHGLDPEVLFCQLLNISLCDESSQFVRQSAVQLICQLFPNKISEKWAEFYQRNVEDEQIKYLILSNALSQFRKNDAIEHVTRLLDVLDPEDEESLAVLRKAAQLVEEAMTKQGLVHRFNSKWSQLNAQMEMVKRRYQEWNREENDSRTKMEEMITSMAHICTGEGGNPIDQCGSKDCY